MRRQVVVGLEVVVAVTAVEVVAAGGADEPVVAEVAEDDVVALVVARRIRVAGLRGLAAGHEDAFELVEVEEELEAAGCSLVEVAGRRERDLPQRVVLVVERELARAPRPVELLGVHVVGVEAQRVARVVRVREVAAGDAELQARIHDLRV